MTTKVNGKNKGNTFERKISGLLSTRFSSFLGIDKAFRRNADSGSFFGGSNSYRAEQHDLDNACFGDVMCPKNFRFTVECKHYKSSPTFQSIVKGNVSQWDDWLEQSENDAKTANKEPLLIVKYNNVPEIVFVKTPLKEKTPIAVYKSFNIYQLSEFLTLDEASFFTSV
jgi:hypothetical protein